MQITFDTNLLSKLCRKYRVKRLALYGSVLRPDFNDASDVDVLVEFHDDSVSGLFDFHRLKTELASVFEGREIDLTTFKALSETIRPGVLAEAKIQYDEAV